MKSISLKLQERILRETESLLEYLHTSRNNYINEAVEFYNQYQKKRLIEEQLAKESRLVSEDSLNILGEFEMLEDEI
jgi:metal-responsive CopG/Arc/MetJ family transcriptional regulator